MMCIFILISIILFSYHEDTKNTKHSVLLVSLWWLSQSGTGIAGCSARASHPLAPAATFCDSLCGNLSKHRDVIAGPGWACDGFSQASVCPNFFVW